MYYFKSYISSLLNGAKGKKSVQNPGYTYNYFFGLLFYRERARVLIFVWICFYHGGISHVFHFLYFFLLGMKACRHRQTGAMAVFS